MHTVVRPRSLLVFALVVLAALTIVPSMVAAGSEAESSRLDHGRGPIVIGHRGAAGLRPEHTLASYQLAINQGADFIEPDVVSTKDRVLVARHENDISGTTDVSTHPEFASRRTTKVIDGNPITGWFTEDFTFAELRTLRAKERLPQLRPQNTVLDGLFPVPSLQEIIDLAKRFHVGIYPETKHPTYFRSIGLPLEEPLLQLLHANGLDRPHAIPVFIQSFEVGNLQRLHQQTRLPLIQLVDQTGRPFDFTVSGDPRTYRDLVTPAGLREVARYATGIGPNKNLILPRDATNHLLPATTLVRDAHRAGLVLHPWTIRPENTFLPADWQVGSPASPAFPLAHGDVETELATLFGLGVDGVFCDTPQTAVAVRSRLAARS
jgi:glycerophosphoryl diester phosphodiesterase